MCKLINSALVLLALINCYAATPQYGPIPWRRITFPTNDFCKDCFVDAQHTIRGTCKTLAACPTALDRWNKQNIVPETCFFNKSEHFVCCEVGEVGEVVEQQPEPLIKSDGSLDMPQVTSKRRSELECEQYYYFKIQVVNGIPTVPREFPYMAALGWKPNFGTGINYLCGGVLISNKFVLTAAHCSRLGGDWPSVVRLGGVNLTDTDVTDVGIKRIIVHPAYNDDTAQNDIALIELEQEVGEMPACVWSSKEVEHSNVTAIGYGHTKFAGVSSDQLLKAPLFIVPNDECSKFFPLDVRDFQSGIEDSHICAGDPQRYRDTCQGDSGGPIIMKVERDSLYSYVVGITSFGRGCAGEPPSIYTRTSAFIDWIENIVWPST